MVVDIKKYLACNTNTAVQEEEITAVQEEEKTKNLTLAVWTFNSVASTTIGISLKDTLGIIPREVAS